jgi:hypothetical protein
LQLRENITTERLNELFSRQTALNMLNTRYIIYRYDTIPLINNAALGNAWFVNNYYVAKDADEEIGALHGINPANEAIVDKRFEPQLSGLKLVADNSRNRTYII